MQMQQRDSMKTSGRRHRRRQGFTVIELLISLAVIGILIGLVFLGVQAARRASGGLVDASTVTQVFDGVNKFREEVGFLPPLVREFAQNVETASVRQAPGITWNDVVVVQGGEFSISVYKRSSDAEFLRGEGSDYLGPTPGNFLRDNRFSQLTLGYYLAGQLEQDLSGPLTGLPIDGVTGPGMYKPERNGSFDVPRQMREPDEANRKRVGRTYGPYVDVGGKSVRTLVDTASNADGWDVTIRDRNDLPLRYYTWLPRATPQGQQPSDADLALPRIVGRVPSPPTETSVPDERNPAVNTALRTARWAIVAAGPNKAFGDEPIDYIATQLGRSAPSGAAEQLRLRLDAARDNIVRVGTDGT